MISFGMGVFKKVNKVTMFVTFGVAWLLIRISMGSFVCNNVRPINHLSGKSQAAYDQYSSEMIPVCHFWQDVVDSSFIMYRLPFQSALIYCASVIFLAAFLELAWVYFKEKQFPIHEESNDWKTFLFVRGGWFFAYLVISMNNTFH